MQELPGRGVPLAIGGRATLTIVADEVLTDDEPTPTALDPCQWCGRQLVRISDNPNDVPPPENLAHAVHAAWKDCVATQRNRWAFCPRAIKGFTSVPVEGTWSRVPLERRTALQ